MHQRVHKRVIKIHFQYLNNNNNNNKKHCDKLKNKYFVYIEFDYKYYFTIYIADIK